MQKIPPSVSQIKRTSVRQVFQGSDTNFDWNRVREQRMASILVASLVQLQSSPSIEKHHFLEKHTAYSTRLSRTQGYESLSSSSNTSVGSKKKKVGPKLTSTKEKSSPSKKGRRRKFDGLNSATERLIVLAIVAVVWAVVCISHPFVKDNMILTYVSSVFAGVVAFYFRFNYPSKKRK